MARKHYLYKIHICGELLIVDSLASRLYLMSLHMHNLEYFKVARLALGCMTDAKLTKEEEFQLDA